MTIQEQISENTLYSNQQELDDLLKDEMKVANAFFINFLGTLGLFAISSSRGLMKTYYASDEKLRVNDISINNKDASLATKLYYDIGGLKPDTTNKITRLLFKLKSRALTAKTLDENLVREIIKEIQYNSHRPHPIILNVVKQFESGLASLKQVAKEFYQVIKTRKKDFLPVAQEFYAIARQYQIYLKDIPAIGTLVPPVTSAVPAPLPSNPTTPRSSGQTAVAVPNQQIPNQDAQTKAETKKATTAKQPTQPQLSKEDFFFALWKATTKMEINTLVKRNGYVALDEPLLQEAIKSLLTYQKTDRTEKVLKAMPIWSVFETAFGSFLKKSQEGFRYYGWLLFWNAFKSLNVQGLNNTWLNIAKYDTDLKKYFKGDTTVVNGEGSQFLMEKLIRRLNDQCHKEIIQANAGTNIKEIFRTYEGTLVRLNQIANESNPGLTILSQFIFGSAMTLDEQIKFLVAYLSDFRTGFNKGLSLLKEKLLKKGIKANLDARFDVLNIPKYDNLFPNSEKIIDAWYHDTKHKKIKFGEIDSVYRQVAEKWVNANEFYVALEASLDSFPEHETATVIAEKILQEIYDYGPTEDKIIASLALNTHQYYKAMRLSLKAAAIISEMQRLCADKYTRLFKEGKIKDVDRFVHDNYAIVSLRMNEYLRDPIMVKNTTPEQITAFNRLITTIYHVSDRMQTIVLKDLLMGTYGSIKSVGVLQKLNITWADFVKATMVLVKKNDMPVGSMGILVTVLREREAVVLSDEDYEALAKFFFPNNLVFAAQVRDPKIFEHMPYEELVAEMKSRLVRTRGMSLDDFKFVFSTIKPEDQKRLLDELKADVFNTYDNNFTTVDWIRLTNLIAMQTEEENRKYIAGLWPSNKVLVVLTAPEIFFQYATDEDMNQTLSDMASKPRKNGRRDLIFTNIQKNQKRLTTDVLSKLIEFYSNLDPNLSAAGKRREAHQYYSAIELLVNRDFAKGEELFANLPLEHRRGYAKYVLAEKFMEATLNEFQGDEVPIKPEFNIDIKRLYEILKYNDVKAPRAPTVKDNHSLKDVMKKVEKIPPFEDLKVEEVQLDPEELERMSIEYDAFNRYKHGEIALKIRRVFDVDIPLQREGYAKWLQRMADEGIDPGIMKPIFHGTSSIGASMILRYGFKVIRRGDKLLAGRMLGDGIYFSNVLDKTAQYVGEVGHTRRFGTKGYIFEMEGSLGKHRRDFTCAGTGTALDGPFRVVSPEWVVYNPNEQLRIYRAYQVEIIPKSQMDALKGKHMEANESENMIQIKSFKQFLNEGDSDNPHCITYVFMDGTIPVSKDKAVEFEKFKPERFGDRVKADLSGVGPSVLIYNKAESKTFVIRYTDEFMKEMPDEFEEYLKLIGTPK